MKLHMKLKTALIAGALVLTPALASAQDDGGFLAGNLLSTTTTSGPTTTTAGIIIGIVLTTKGGDKKSQNDLRDYVNANRNQVASAVHVGGGEAAHDLANMFGVREGHEGAFAAALRTHRAELTEAMGTERMSAEGAQRFIQVVFEAMQHDETLARDLAYWQDKLA